jgi:hypothetical protein
MRPLTLPVLLSLWGKGPEASTEAFPLGLLPRQKRGRTIRLRRICQRLQSSESLEAKPLSNAVLQANRRADSSLAGGLASACAGCLDFTVPVPALRREAKRSYLPVCITICHPTVRVFVRHFVPSTRILPFVEDYPRVLHWAIQAHWAQLERCALQQISDPHAPRAQLLPATLDFL